MLLLLLLLLLMMMMMMMMKQANKQANKPSHDITSPQAELRDHLEALGSVAEPSRLRSLLMSSLELSPGASGGLAPPVDVEVKAYLLAVAACDVWRAAGLPQACQLEGAF
jgi:hypothetical protein